VRRFEVCCEWEGGEEMFELDEDSDVMEMVV